MILVLLQEEALISIFSSVLVPEPELHILPFPHLSLTSSTTVIRFKALHSGMSDMEPALLITASPPSSQILVDWINVNISSHNLTP